MPRTTPAIAAALVALGLSVAPPAIAQPATDAPPTLQSVTALHDTPAAIHDTYATALAHAAQRDGLVLTVLIGSDWSTPSVRLRDTLLADATRRALGPDAALFVTDFPQRADEDAVATLRLLREGLDLNNRYTTFPAVVVNAGDGTPLLTLEGPPLCDDPAAGAQAVVDAINTWRLRDALIAWADAHAATDRDAAIDALGQAARLPVAAPDDLIDRIATLDPDDARGWAQALTLPNANGQWDLIVKRLDEGATPGDIIAEQQTILENPRLTDVQRASVHIVIGRVHAHGDHTDAAIAAYEQAIAAAPDHWQGRAFHEAAVRQAGR